MAQPKIHKERIDLYNLYCKQYPKATQYGLAKLLYMEHPHVFKDLESARSMIRAQDGNGGNRKRKSYRDQSKFKKLTHDTNNAGYRQEEIYSKILILDIETAPLLANIWGIWNQNISTDNIRSDWFMLTWSAKWLFEKKVYSARVTAKEAKLNDDKRIVKSLLDIISQADIVVTHNGDKFDLPRINTRALVHRLDPPLPYISIDTLKAAKRHFAFTSNKLDYINKMLKLPQKTKTDMELWRDCFNGDDKALQRMEKYNINDVRIHEQTYLAMRPFIKPHPNIGLHIIDGETRCPSCGSNKIQDTGKAYYTSVNAYSVFKCKCGATGRMRKALKKNNVLAPVAR